MPFDDPEDIYQWVSDVVCRRMEVDRAGNGANAEAARQLLAIMDRELAKNATMTTPYGVTLRTKIDVRKQVDGIVAHLVHSMDAAHMMLTINRLHAEGIRHFAMVHDSYGVHACDVDLLNRVLREEFVRIYSEPVLLNFLDQQRKAHPGISLPDPPQTGDLDIQQVLSSPYFFA